MASSTVVVESLGEEKSSSEQCRKVFIGGLSYTTTDEILKEYCSKSGEITECIIMRDREGRSRGFAFVSFKDYLMVDYFIKYRPHIIDGKKIEVKRALPRDKVSKSEEQLTVEKIFIGGIKEDLTENDLKLYFKKFGKIIECHIMKDKEDKLRGFAFITFDDYDSVDRCILEKPHFINEKELDVRKAIPREQTSRINASISNNNINPEFNYQSHLIFNHSILSPLPYTHFYPSNYLSKPIPLMSTTNSYSSSNYLSSPTLFYPSELPKKISRTRSINDEQYRKLFIGGLSFKTTNETLKNYVTKYGEITDCLVMKDQNGQSKCFGFVTFINSNLVDEFMKQRPHILDGRQIDPKRAMLREEANKDDVHLTVKKIFIGGIRDGFDEDLLRKYFEKYGKINDCLLMYDKNGKTRGFAFIEYDDYDSVDKVILARPHTINEYRIDVKKAIPKDQRLFQAQQQQYALQMQAAAAAYYYNNLPYHILNSPITSFSPLMTLNGAFIDDNRTSNFLRYGPTRNQ